MRQLYLIRHCESRFIAHGEASLDSPLSEAGVRQAEQLRVRLTGLPLELTLTSLLRRARETAEAIAPEGVPIYASPALNEYPLDDAGSGMESAASGLARSARFLHSFSPYHRAIAVVTHNSILTTLLTSILNLPWPNVDVGAFETPGTCRVLRFDWDLGDTVWRELEAFEPSGTRLRRWQEVIGDEPQRHPDPSQVTRSCRRALPGPCVSPWRQTQDSFAGSRG
jgi:broad specificity phosphatase PhoE